MSVLWLIISVCVNGDLVLQSAPTRQPFVLNRPLSQWVTVRLLSAHMDPRGSVEVPRSLGKHASVLQSGGSRCKEQLWVPPTMLGGPIREQNLARRTSSKHAANGTFICLPSHPLPQRPSFTGIHSAISSSPMATAGLVNRGTTFSWCHRAMNDLQPLESWWNSLNWYFLANTKQHKLWIYRYEASLWTG